MPKANKKDTTKKKIQARALYELGKYKNRDIYEQVGIDHKTLKVWINENPNDIWQIRDLSENRIYEAEKLVQTQKIMRNFKKEEDKIKDDVITKNAKKDATKEAMALVDLERERNRVLTKTLENAEYVNQYIVDTIRKGKTGTMMEEDIMLNGKRVEGGTKRIRTVEEHKIPELVRAGELIAKTLHGLGFLQTPQQQQNTQINIGTQQMQNIPVEVATEEEADDVRRQLLAQLK
jgi:hypothetical protein